MKPYLFILLSLSFLNAGTVIELNEGFNDLSSEKAKFDLRVEHFNKEMEKKKKEILELIDKNDKILSDIKIKEKEIAKQQEKLDNLYNNIYNKSEKKIISFYSQMKPAIIADVFSKLVVEDIDKAMFIIQNIPEKQAIGTMMKLDNTINSLLTQKLLKRKTNAKK